MSKSNAVGTLLVALVLGGILSGCGNVNPTYSLLPDQNIFQQSEGKFTSNKIDILWVIDNSGSMADEQTNIANNFNAFIQSFVQKNYDFHIGVVTTDSWWSTYYGQAWSNLKDGYSQHSGVFVIDPSTPNLIPTFIKNVQAGTGGTGDERAFQSFKNALDNPNNVAFRRPDAYLAIIIVSDEDDFSNNTADLHEDYNYIGNYSIQTYTDYLDAFTQSSGATRRYSVNAIAAFSQACLNANQYARLAVRYDQIVTATNGIKGDICSANYSNELNLIQNHIAELSTQFFLNRVPKVETIVVKVNNVVIAQNAANGWTYNAQANSIVFHGSAVPAQGSTIVVDFDPVTIK